MHYCALVGKNDLAYKRLWRLSQSTVRCNNKLNASDTNEDDGNDRVLFRSTILLSYYLEVLS